MTQNQVTVRCGPGHQVEAGCAGQGYSSFRTTRADDRDLHAQTSHFFDAASHEVRQYDRLRLMTRTPQELVNSSQARRNAAADRMAVMSLT